MLEITFLFSNYFTMLMWPSQQILKLVIIFFLKKKIKIKIQGLPLQHCKIIIVKKYGRA
jgi:hypothetical protein